MERGAVGGAGGAVGVDDRCGDVEVGGGLAAVVGDEEETGAGDDDGGDETDDEGGVFDLTTCRVWPFASSIR